MKYIVKQVGVSKNWEVGEIVNDRFYVESSWEHEGIANQRAFILNNPGGSRIEIRHTRVERRSCDDDDETCGELGGSWY